MKEIWKDIPGYEGEYQASNLGRIKSLERKVKSKNQYTNKEFYRTVPSCILKPGQYSKNGHVSVVLGKGTNGQPVHKLVAITFLGPYPKGQEVLHINGIPKDNRLENLRYGTRTENILDVYYQGGKWRKLSIDDVYFIRFALLCEFSGKKIAEILGVSQTTISTVKTGRSFSWLK